MPTHRLLYRRRFLNRPRHHLGAHVIAEVSVETPAKGDGRPWVDGTLHVADCSRCVTLDLSADTAAEARNVLRKVALLRAVLVDVEVALTRAFEDTGLRRP